MILPNPRSVSCAFHWGGVGTKKHEVEAQSARPERDFAIHKVLPVLITGGGGTKEGRGYDFTITLNAICTAAAVGCYRP